MVLGAPSSKDRFDAATTLLDYGFGNYRAAPLPEMEQCPAQLPVKGSPRETMTLDYSALPESILLPKTDAGELTVQLQLPESLTAPVQKGQTLGRVQVLDPAGSTLLGEYEVYAAADAPKTDFGTALGMLWEALKG